MYKIDWMEKKQSAKGNNYYKAILKASDGSVVNDVTIFESFGPVELGGTVEGILKPNEYQGKTSYVLEKSVKAPSWVGKKGTDIAKAQERKEIGIEKTLDRKEDSYKVSGTARDAVLCAIAELHKFQDSEESLESLIKKWRAWLWNEYDKTDKDFPPFN